MVRPLRLEFPGALYHVTTRGDGREDIYLGDEDRRGFLDLLGDVCRRFNWLVSAYCLMGNHYHLLVETREPNLSKGMRQLNGVYAQRFNKGHGRVGHVFQGRYDGILVQQEAYRLELTRYIILNPVRARIVREVGNWPWSSYRATVGVEEAPDWMDIRATLLAFGRSEAKAVERYVRFVANGKGQPSPWEHLKNRVFLGSDAFVDAMHQHVPRDRDLREIPQARARSSAKPLSSYARDCGDRNGAIVAAYASGGYTMKAIGDYFGLHYSRVSKIVRDAEREKGKT